MDLNDNSIVINDIAVSLAKEMIGSSPCGSSFYLLGNAADFEEFCRPIFQKIGDGVAGLGCLWTRELKYADPNGRKQFNVYQELLEECTDFQYVVLCQSVIAHANEVIMIIERARNYINLNNIIVLTAETSANEVSYVKQYVKSEIGIDALFFIGREKNEELNYRQIDVFSYIKRTRLEGVNKGKFFIFEEIEKRGSNYNLRK